MKHLEKKCLKVLEGLDDKTVYDVLAGMKSKCT